MPTQEPGHGYDALRERFSWDLPTRFNIGVACSDAHAPHATALIALDDKGVPREYTFGDLAALSARLGNGLAGAGIGPGDRVGIVLPQCVEAGIAHLALYKLGAIAVPLSGLFGPDALAYRLGDSDAKGVITGVSALEQVREAVRDVETPMVVSAGAEGGGTHGFWDLVDSGAPDLRPAETTPDTPALLIYTSGTTGPPKGALHGHRVLLGHLPGYELMFDFFPQEHDRVWTPADWAWIGGLMDALMPAWYHGRPVVGAPRQRFDPDWAVQLMADHAVTTAFLPPTALKLMRQAGVSHREGVLRTVMSGGEPLGAEMLTWARDHLGVTVNEIFGQTEANLVVGNCASAWEVRPGSMGRPYPGHEVEIVTADGALAEAGAQGEIAVRAPDPVMFLEYWNRADATAEKFHGEWLLTGDIGRRDADGYLWYAARTDDVINSAGYRIGPGEVEECLLRHPAVAMAAAVGVPDEVRGQVVKAFVVVADGHGASDGLEAEIRDLVRGRLAAYEYPREIEFVDELPMTTTGKIRRHELRQREERRAATPPEGE